MYVYFYHILKSGIGFSDVSRGKFLSVISRMLRLFLN